jgi:hypothetical protein
VRRRAAYARAKEQQQATTQVQQQLGRRAAHGAVPQQLLQVLLLEGL